MSRAIFLRSAATESSRSRIRPSGPESGPLASLRSESAGTNRNERIGRPHFFEHVRRRVAIRFERIFLPAKAASSTDGGGMDARGAPSYQGRHRTKQAMRERVMRAMMSEMPGGP